MLPLLLRAVIRIKEWFNSKKSSDEKQPKADNRSFHETLFIHYFYYRSTLLNSF